MGSKQLDLYLMSYGTREYTSQIQVTWPLATPFLRNNKLGYQKMSNPKVEERKGNKIVCLRDTEEGKRGGRTNSFKRHDYFLIFFFFN